MKMAKPPTKFTIPILYVSVLERHNGRDRIRLELDPSVVHHSGFESYNDNSLKFETVEGNGVDCLRKMGWRGPITLTANYKTTQIPALPEDPFLHGGH